MKTCYLTFHSVSGSLAFENAIKETNLNVRLVPVPRQISSSCGVAAMFSPEIKEQVLEFVEENDIEYDEFHELDQKNEKSLFARFKEKRK